MTESEIYERLESLESDCRYLLRELGIACTRVQALEATVSELRDLAMPCDETGCAVPNEGGDP